jgi:ketosteroid isomerase-like protein
VLESDLAQTIEQDHEALNALVTGDPEPKKGMFSRRDDVTLANPLGPPVRGWSEVERILEGVASGFREGEPHHFERISEYATRDLAYLLEIERTRAKFGGATTIWRLEAGEWRIALRHADPITSARPLESILEP